MLNKILHLFNTDNVDPVTIKEVEQFAQQKFDEQMKIKGQIARDLARIGDNAFKDPAAYDKLRAKYKARWTNTKRLAILDMMQREWAHEKPAD